MQIKNSSLRTQHKLTTETGENKLMKKKEKTYSSPGDEDLVLITQNTPSTK